MIGSRTETAKKWYAVIQTIMQQLYMDFVDMRILRNRNTQAKNIMIILWFRVRLVSK